MQLPVYVVNLDRRPDRWAAISTNLDRIGVEAERLSAIDADRAMLPASHGLNAAQAACMESQLCAMQELLWTNHPAALILEDDAELAPPVRGLLSGLDWWPRGARVVKLNASSGKRYLLGRVAGATPCGRELRPIAWASAVACAYMIDRRGADSVLDGAPVAGMTADSLLFHMIGSPVARRLRPVQVVPALAKVRANMGSDIPFEFSPRTTGPGMRFLLKTGVWARRATGEVRRISVPCRTGG